MAEVRSIEIDLKANTDRFQRSWERALWMVVDLGRRIRMYDHFEMLDGDDD